MSTESKYPGYPQDLVLDITTYVPLARARELLYKNGEIDPRVCSLEVEIYRQSCETPGVYVGYYKGENPMFTKFSDAKEAEKATAQIKEADGSVGDVIIVDAQKGGK